MIFHIPHASRVIPAGDRSPFLLDPLSLNRELINMTDSYVDELFDGAWAVNKVVFPVSRLVVDVERFLDDRDEKMAQVGMGAVYTRTHDLRRLRSVPTEDERNELISRYYLPHHQKLTLMAERILEEKGHCLIIDCHSFPSRPLPYELVQDSRRPDICLGTDDYHTPPEISEKLKDLFRETGFTVSFNTPFAGCMVPLDFHRNDKSLSAVMIEINRSLYMDENTGEKSEKFETFKRRLTGIIEKFLQE